MALHLVKLSVGSESIDDHIGWQREAYIDKGVSVQHVTRMVPNRIAELLDGGSLYWVIKGSICLRQRLVDIQAFVAADGVGRCRLVLEPECVRVQPQPKRAFQGWRYLLGHDAPSDLGKGATDLPDALRLELAALGLL